MTAFTSLPAVQAAVIAKTRGDATLMAMISAIVDEVPQSQSYPYVVYEDPFEIPDRCMGQDGFEAHFMLIVFTQDGTPLKSGAGYAGFKTGLNIAARLATLITDIFAVVVPKITVTGFDVVNADVESVEAFREADGITRRIEMKFIMQLEDNPSAP